MKNFFLAALCIVLLASCATEKFYAPSPSYNAEENKYTPQASYISLPVEVQMSTITASMNKLLSGLIYEDNDFQNNGGDNLKIRVWRSKKEITIDGEKDKLKLYFPLEIWAMYELDPCDICPTVSKATSFEMDVYMQTNLKVGKSWEVIPTTQVNDIKFITSPTLSFDVGVDVIKIPITTLVKKALMANIQTITGSIDKEVTNSVPLKKYMTQVWDMVQDPLLMDSTYKTWLTLSPVEIYLTPLVCDKKKLSLNAGLSTFIYTRLGEKPAVQRKYTLTDPVIKDKLDNKFSLELPVTIDFKMATELANRNFKDSVYQVSKKKKIKINDVLIYGKGGDVFVKADLSGSFNGIVYFKGHPTLDTATNKIFFKDIDFDINTKNALYKAAAWLLHGTVKKIMEKNFVYDITRDIEGAKTAIQNYLQGYKYEDLLTIKGNIDELRLKKIITDEEGVQVIFYTSGKVGMNIDNIKGF